MQRPDFGENWWRKLCQKIVLVCESDLYKYVIRHILFVFPPAFGAWLFSGADGVDLVEKLGALGGFLERSSFLILIGAWAWVMLCRTGYSVIRHYAKPKRGLSRDQVLAILQSIYRVVSPKSHRMREYAHKFYGDKYEAGEVFDNITQPEEQLKLLTTAVHGIFEYLDSSNASWKVRLCRIEGGRPVEWMCYEPAGQPPRTELEMLAAPTSGISRCINSRSLHIVEDVERAADVESKAQRQCIRGVGKGTQGSLLCAPVMHPNNQEVLFVLCVSCNSARLICEEDREYYEWLLDHFLARLVIEASLYVLKQGARNEQKNPS